MKFYGQKSENFFAQNPKEILKRKTKINCLFRIFYSGHVDRILRTIIKFSAENPKRFRTFWKKAANCSSGHVEGSFENFLKFFGQKSENFFAQNPKKIWKKKQKLTVYSAFFYSGHVDRFFRAMPKVCAENPKRFRTLKKIKSQIVPLDTQKVVLTTSWSFLAKSVKKFRSKSEKIPKRKAKKTCFSRKFYSGHLDRILRTHAKSFCRKSKTVQNIYKNFKATNCSSGHAEGSFDNFLKFLGQKSENISLKIGKKFWKEKLKKMFLPQIFLWTLR